jgi:hypothetical protein
LLGADLAALVGKPDRPAVEGWPRLLDYLEYDPASPTADTLRAELRPADAPNPDEIRERAAALRLAPDSETWPGEWDPLDVEHGRAQRYGDARGTAIAEDTIGPGVGTVVPAGTFKKGRAAQDVEDGTDAGSEVSTSGVGRRPGGGRGGDG